MIVFFSGTGNSRYVADMLSDLLQDEVIDIFTYIRKHKRAKLTSRKPWIFVAPVYVSAPPTIFMSFLRYSVFQGSKEAYFVSTCAGGMGACPYYFHQICQEKGLKDMGTSQIIMPQNYLIYFKTKSEVENNEIIQNAQSEIVKLANRIHLGEHFDDHAVKAWEIAATKPILKPYYKFFIRSKAFHSGDSCISCGICEKACPFGNIKLMDGKVKWGRTCTHCMACINVCPKKCIEYEKKTVGKPRYYCKTYESDR